MTVERDVEDGEPVEVWLPIEGYDGRYDVSNCGRVRSHIKWRGSTGRILAQHIHKDRGYPQTHLATNGRPKTFDVHKLVCAAFHGPQPVDQEVRHLNDIKTDNRAENLVWGTKQQNSFDAVRNGTHPMAKKSRCVHGHEFTPENTRIYDGRRWCRRCKAIEQYRRRKRKQENRRQGEAA